MSSSGQNSIAGSATPSVRGKIDPAWQHVSEGRDPRDGKKTFMCLYCKKTIKGGGINRMKQHLAGRRGEIGLCKSVPHDVRYQMEESLKSITEKKQQGQEIFESQNPYNLAGSQMEGDMQEDDIQEISGLANKDISFNESSGRGSQSCMPMAQKGKRKAHIGIGSYFAPRSTPGSQPSIKSALAGKEAVWRANMAVARFVFDTCISINALNSIYFQPMLDAVNAIGPGYKGPSYHDMRISLLRDCKKEVQLFVDSFRSVWAETGCTIMADGWTDSRQQTLINFMVYCPRGIVLVKSVDASDVVKTAENLFKLFKEIVEWVGAPNVVHMVTDNAANYVAAGRMLNEAYRTINWSPCAAHCLNLILGDIAKMEHVADIAKRASKVTKFVYNHAYLLSWLRKRPNWTEIVRPGMTRFATTFIALHSVYQHMHDLQALVTSKDYVDSRYSRDKKLKDAVAIILDKKFWTDCSIIVKIVEPLMRLLRIVDSDEKPAMGYLYEGMLRVRFGIKQIFMNKKRLYKPYTKIIKDRWDRQLRQSIHAAAYWLNPTFQYNQVSFFTFKPEVMAGLLDVIEAKATCSKTKLLSETRFFRDRLESFSRELALSTCKTTRPDEWWRLFGHSAPNLQKLAIRLLSQTCSSSGCERNWSVFERIHTKKRNRLEHQMLNDLVYVHYNLRLKNRNSYKKRTYDPVDYESIDYTEFLIAEEEDNERQEPSLDLDELEKLLYEEGAIPRSERQDDDTSDFINVEEGMDLGVFGDESGYDDVKWRNNADSDVDWLTKHLTPGA